MSGDRKFLDLSRSKSAGQSVLFYFFSLIILILLCGLLGGFFAILTGASSGKESFEAGQKFGTIVAIISCTGLSVFIMYKKNLWKKTVAWVCAALAFAGSIVLGGLLGLVFTTILYAMHSNNFRRS